MNKKPSMAVPAVVITAVGLVMAYVLMFVSA